MGVPLSTLWERLVGKKQYKVILIGLDSAGKSTIFSQLRFGEALLTIPTVGSNVATLYHKDHCFVVWDIGGQRKVRCLWKFFVEGINGIIFVVDSTDRERINEARNELHKVLKNKQLSKTLLVVFANKQDVPNIMTLEEIKDELDLDHLQGHKWMIRGTCALTGQGLYEGFSWLSKELTKEKNQKMSLKRNRSQ